MPAAKPYSGQSPIMSVNALLYTGAVILRAVNEAGPLASLGSWGGP